MSQTKPNRSEIALIKKHGVFASVRKGEDIGFFGVVTVYENGRKLWQEVLWNVHRLTRADEVRREMVQS